MGTSMNCGTIRGMATGTGQPQRGLELGYARVSATRQSLVRQLDALSAAGIPDERIYTDKKTGRSLFLIVPVSAGEWLFGAGFP